MIGHTVCTAHQGRHGVVDGRCWIPAREQPQPFRWRFTHCERCWASVDVRTEVRTGESITLSAGTDTPHWHEPPLTVSLDPAELAEAIVAASRAARQERQPVLQTPVQTPPQTVFAGTGAALPEPPQRGGISGIEVVRPE